MFSKLHTLFASAENSQSRN